MLDIVTLFRQNEFMRRARFTYPGAFHHVINRGIRGEYIFPGDVDKQTFSDILAEKTRLLGIRLIGYCVMNNHYRVLLENSSGRMSALLKVVNGTYGIYYRRKHGGRLKELSVLTYREIAQLPEFRDIKLHSLGKLYKDARKRIAARKR